MPNPLRGKRLVRPKASHAPGRSHAKRPVGRPPKTEGLRDYCYEREFFQAVREQLTPKERLIFKTSTARLQALSAEECKDGLYPRDAHAVKRVVDKVKASVISVEYMQKCLGMERNQYNVFIRHIKLDAVGKNSILAAKGYAIVAYFRERYEMPVGKLFAKSGTEDHGLTFELFEDLIKIAVHDREALLNKPKKSQKKQ